MFSQFGFRAFLMYDISFFIYIILLQKKKYNNKKRKTIKSYQTHLYFYFFLYRNKKHE